MYKKILVPLDGSALAERAIWHAGEIARGADAEILLLQAVYVPIPVVPESALLTEGKVLEEVARGALEYLDRIGADLRASGHRVRTIIDERPPAEAILHTAGQEQVDLIVMSTHGRSGLSRLMLGSIAESVLRHTHQTILFVKPERPAAMRAKDEHRDTAVP
ncbi:MAG: universal stress protein [Deltaproteobacteria bacterium]|nr:universal stress protein [Deltaproteobacteria bacterium]